MTATIVLLATLLSTSPTPAEKKIQAARSAIERTPESYQARNALAMALARRARETADPELYRQANDALDVSFQMASDNYTGLRTRAWVLLGQHEFEKALALAESLNRKAPDDIMVYGLLTDAYMELGNYEKAEEAAQWMLDLRPGNLAGLTRGAYLREIFGDVDGAIEWMQAAYELAPLHETEDRAWVMTQLAHLELSRGELERAEAAANTALALFPEYHYALAELAKIRRAQDRDEEAVALLEKRYRLAAHPENLFELAMALSSASRIEKAQELFLSFEQQARHEMAGHDNANRELIFYYADVVGDAEAALSIARLEVERRRDVLTLDAYAWALFRNDQLDEAWNAIQRALAPGIQRAQLFDHAAKIAAARGDDAEAEHYSRRAVGLIGLSR